VINNKNLISISVAAFTLTVLGIAQTSFNEIELHRAYASISSNNNTISLGDPFFVERGKVIGQRVLSVTPQPQLEFTIVANGTINNSINFTNTGTSISNLQADGAFTSKGQGFITTENGEVAIWTNQVVGQRTQDGNIISYGSGIWSTPSTGDLAFMNNLMTIFILEIDSEGNLSAREWEWS
jgi:hypothetical protein